MDHPPTQSPLPAPEPSGFDSPSASDQPRHSLIRPFSGVSWALLFALIGLLMALPFLAGQSEEAAAEQERLAAQIAAETVESQGKIFLGLKYGLDLPPESLAGQLAALNDGEAAQRQRYAVLAYEFAGLDAARAALDSIDQLSTLDSDQAAPEETALALNEDSRAVQQALRALYGSTEEGDVPAATPDEPAPTPENPVPPRLESLTDADRAALIDHLGFLGEVAVNPPSLLSEADRDELFVGVVQFIIWAIVFFILFGLAALAGFVGLIVMLVQALIGRLRSRVMHAGPYTGVYIETVALWVVVFFASQMLLAPLLAAALPASAQMLAVFIVFMGTLVVLAWPVVRGVPWAVVRRDIGWTLGERPGLEPVLGVAGYFMMIPIMVVGIILTFALLMLARLVFGDIAMPIHPIAGEAEGSVSQLVFLLLLACVAAPIVEETIFRGLMYRHLRDSSRRMSPAGSILLSGLISALIFAIIHPEGILGTPAKASIGLALAFMREWRGTLIPSMIMHGLNNAVVITLLWAMMNV